MRVWTPTPALLRAGTLAAIGLVVALVLGSPAIAVLVAPLAWQAAIALRARPAAAPAVDTRLGDAALREGQGTLALLRVADPTGIEHVTRVAVPTSYVAHHPAGGRLGLLLTADAPLPMELSPRRWGRRRLGHERIWLTSTWAGFRYGPIEAVGREVLVLPQGADFDSRAEVPQPRGLVGAHRSVRESSGAEFAGIRPYQPGDRLRRINWRVSTRTDRLHVTTAQAEVDAGVLLVVDALADLGSSGGIEGAASSLDLAVRAAAALAEHHVAQGDRVALRVVGLEGATVDFGVGRRHLRRILGTLAAVRPGAPHRAVLDHLRLRAGAGATVVVLSPMLVEQVATATAELVRRGVPTLVVDTLPPSLSASDLDLDRTAGGAGGDADTAADTARRTALRQAWRMRTIEREQVLASLAAVGCPVVAWRGPGTLDDVLRRLARRAVLPRMR